jgi:UDP-glucose 4-epimerase
MKVLVTGGAGFIGSHLVEELVRLKFKVVVIDNLSTGNIKNLKSVKKKIKFINYDISKILLDKSLGNFDFVFHLAGLSKVVESFKKPKIYYKTNVLGTVNILNLIKNTKIKKFIYAASASCYGKPKNIPTSEKDQIKTLSPYAQTKFKAEQIIMKKAFKEKFPAISLRLFNVYGPRSTAKSSYSSVISVFYKKKLRNEPFTVVGDGLQTRDFIHVSDVVRAMIKAAQSKVYNQVFNVGTQKTVNINKIAKLFRGKKKYISERKGEIEHSLANINKIKKVLKWKPKISINKGINLLLKKQKF